MLTRYFSNFHTFPSVLTMRQVQTCSVTERNVTRMATRTGREVKSGTLRLRCGLDL
jgi:hypothetical protein